MLISWHKNINIHKMFIQKICTGASKQKYYHDNIRVSSTKIFEFYKYREIAYNKVKMDWQTI